MSILLKLIFLVFIIDIVNVFEIDKKNMFVCLVGCLKVF